MKPQKASSFLNICKKNYERLLRAASALRLLFMLGFSYLSLLFISDRMPAFWIFFLKRLSALSMLSPCPTCISDKFSNLPSVEIYILYNFEFIFIKTGSAEFRKKFSLIMHTVFIKLIYFSDYLYIAVN